MTTQQDIVTICWPPVSVAALGVAMDRVLSGFQALWAAGRLRHLLDSSDTRAALEQFDHGRAAALDQWHAAAEAGRPTVAFSISFPTEAALLTVALMRRLVDLLCDPETMDGVGEEALRPDDRALVVELVDFAERSLDRPAGR